MWFWDIESWRKVIYVAGDLYNLSFINQAFHDGSLTKFVIERH